VTAFLAEAADDYAEAIREAERLRQENARLEGLVNEHREHERNLRNTLMTAQRLADEISDNAHKQAATIIKDAESRASLILEKAQARYEDVQREIDGCDEAPEANLLQSSSRGPERSRVRPGAGQRSARTRSAPSAQDHRVAGRPPAAAGSRTTPGGPKRRG
jgi:cell division septum initiation protein DivIVA